ncbi:MAG TPA: prepilin-type N-terminal cleavage/methylation domain-containing protein [Nitrospirae bacterium]|nr:prepilin-type N-terminal cleavage/methylation domain-containing protein [Nitrospirota bacterium]
MRKMIRTGKKGFTLLELILAITLFSLVALIIGAGFRLGIKAWEKGDAETFETQKLRALSGLISQSIKSAYPYKMEIDGEETVLFEGDEHSIIFATALVDPSFGGFKWVMLSYSEGALRFADGVLPDKEFRDADPEDEEVIDPDTEEIRFEYLAGPDDEWEESWEFGDKLPVAVRVKIAYFQPFLITLPLGLAGQEEHGHL